jgi:hypothetical protein
MYEKPFFDDNILHALSILTWTQPMMPVEPALRFEFQATHQGRARLRKTVGAECLLLRHARYILKNADLLKTLLLNPDRAEGIIHFDKSSYIWTKDADKRFKVNAKGGYKA